MYAEFHTQTASAAVCPGILGQGQEGAFQLYLGARGRGRRGQLLSRLTGKRRHLLDLASVEANCEIRDRSSAGVQTVTIRQIRGSEGRCGYFDREFQPLHDEARGRWLSIARARQQGKNLPPVSLVQVGDIYFVRDGHHRISVARALGQIEIDARVTVWQVTGPLPWDATAQTRRPGVKDRLRRLVSHSGTDAAIA